MRGTGDAGEGRRNPPPTSCDVLSPRLEMLTASTVLLSSRSLLLHVGGGGGGGWGGGGSEAHTCVVVNACVTQSVINGTAATAQTHAGFKAAVLPAQR